MTYNQIIQRFEWWADGHPMLYYFTHGEFEIADLTRETAYPAIHVQPLSVRYGVQVRTYRFEVYIFELYRENGDEANEVREDLSDTLQIFEDLIAELRNGFDAFDRKEFLPVFPIEPTPFIQEHNGVLTGVQATIEIETSFFADACDSPVNPANPPSQLCPVGMITLNGVEFGTVASGGTLAGLVQYVNGTPVGSLVGEIWTIPNPAACDDVTITVNSEAYSTVASGGSDDIPVVNSAATPIGTVTPGGDVTIGNMTLDFPDSTTQALVIVPGSTVTIPPHWTVQLTGTVASPFTVVSPAWDSSFVCATEALTGGTISSITINGGAPIATFVGASIPASATIVVTFASSLTQIVLTFN